MPEISSLTRQKLVSVTVDLGDGDTVGLVFDRNKVTPAWLNATQQGLEGQDILSVAKGLAAVIDSWDVTDEGAAYPPTADNISVLTIGAANALLEKIMEAAVPSSAEGNASSATSSTAEPSSTAPPVSPQNGPAPSPSPAPSASPSPT